MASIYQRSDSRRWQIKFMDEHGRTRQQSSGVTDKALARRMADDLQREVDLRRRGVITPDHDRQIRANKTTITAHIRDYIADGEERGHAPKYLHQKRVHLSTFVEVAKIKRLLEVTPEGVKAHLRSLEAQGLSGRSRAIRRSTIKAFLNWCVQQRRLGENPITKASVPKPDESPQRRRRALTDIELCRLLAVAECRGRKAWYACAAMAGLRKGDLQRLRWCDIDFEAGRITIMDGKRQRKARSSGRAVRPDVIPLHPELEVILKEHRSGTMSAPQGPVFPTSVSDNTRRKDFVRAGLARWIEHRGMEGKLIRREYDATDEQGRVVDLHALRATLATNLARAGVPMAFTQEILRHEDARTTQRHYISVSQKDAAEALGALKFDAG